MANVKIIVSALALTFLTFFSCISFAQAKNLASVKWMQLKDTSHYHLNPGFYLCKPLPEADKRLGFSSAASNSSYLIGREEFLSFKNIDSIYKMFDKSLKAYILTLRFNTKGSEELRIYTMKWSGHQIGLLVNNKLITEATVAAPISGGLVSISGKFSDVELDHLKNSIQKASVKLRK